MNWMQKLRAQELPMMYLRFVAWTFTFMRKWNLKYIGQLIKETVCTVFILGRGRS